MINYIKIELYIDTLNRVVLISKRYLANSFTKTTLVSLLRESYYEIP